LDRQLARLAAVDKKMSVVVKCTGDSNHETLVNVLNACTRLGLTKVSIFSM
jgi:hypothetical protein